MKKVPKFNSREEEIQFWETHDPLDFEEPDAEVNITMSPQLQKERRLKQVTIRLRLSQVLAAKEIAKRKDIPYQVLMRSWINEAIKKER
ncbi:MAG TPA: CopG family antitoxin [Methylomusa anaerophila]|uniref:CopG antitoxin of type II toxin-antitoxin system n=1 Tax=Methylomusa anaerophila TaxID=1930071 RepID=A0A348AHB9_9FIRM|nr:CopG family antitoxin [Methylomusa anaerophila]BBB90467.1 hypothetical protein MAMMFC1_01118 [Methylomusa anaerophila]HML89891.1 CopG family antitoxin [Methylomusa anaerophila]